jgi:nucleotide-binding universal stress UspA family protein
MMPPRTVLAAVDFSVPSRVALEFAARLANQCQATLHVLHVQDPLLAAAAHARGLDLARDTRDELARFTGDSVAAGAWTPLHHHVITGPATGTICDIAAREQADMIVLGMHGMAGASHALFGSTTEGVLRRSETPMFVIPDSWAPPDPSSRDLSGTGPVVAAIEGSCTAIAAAVAATRLAAVLKTSVHAIHVVPELTVLERWRPHADAVIAEQTARAQAEISAALAAAKSDIPVRFRVETGSVAQRLADAVNRVPAAHPILVLGRHTRGSRRGIPGATAYRVLGLTRVPVLVYCVADEP